MKADQRTSRALNSTGSCGRSGRVKDILSSMGINSRYYMYCATRCIVCALARPLPEDSYRSSDDGHFET